MAWSGAVGSGGLRDCPMFSVDVTSRCNSEAILTLPELANYCKIKGPEKFIPHFSIYLKNNQTFKAKRTTSYYEVYNKHRTKFITTVAQRLGRGTCKYTIRSSFCYT